MSLSMMDDTTQALTRQLEGAHIPPELHPILSFITHALMLQSSRMSKLKAQMISLSETMSLQAEQSDMRTMNIETRMLSMEEATSNAVAFVAAHAKVAEDACTQLQQQVSQDEPKIVIQARIEQLEHAYAQQEQALNERAIDLQSCRESVTKLQVSSECDGSTRPVVRGRGRHQCR